MDALLTVDEVANVTRLQVSTIRKLVWRELIPFVRLGAAIRFRPAEIERWVANQAHGGANVVYNRTDRAAAGSMKDGLLGEEFMDPILTNVAALSNGPTSDGPTDDDREIA